MITTAPLSAAVESGDHRSMLEALRASIAAQIDEGVGARDLASLARRLQEISRELSELPDPTDESEAERIARERRARRAADRATDAPG